MWEYISATEGVADKYGYRQLLTIEQLVDQYNKENKTNFVGINDGWLRHNTFGSCHIKTLDGMCGVLIAHKLGIYSHFVKEFYPLIEFMARKGNYTYMMMSNVVGGERLEAWKDMKFETMLAFKNRRTLNDVELLIKKVPKE